MKKYETEQYLFENIKHKIYPWVKESMADYQVINGPLISENIMPIISFVGDLMIIFVIDRGDGRYEMVKDDMLPTDTDIEELYHQACVNLAGDIDFVISQTLYGGFGIVADGHHEASALCFKQIWQMCTEKLADDVVIMAPAKDMILFVPRANKQALQEMVQFGEEAFRRNRDKISKRLLLFSKEDQELRVYKDE